MGGGANQADCTLNKTKHITDYRECERHKSLRGSWLPKCHPESDALDWPDGNFPLCAGSQEYGFQMAKRVAGDAWEKKKKKTVSRLTNAAGARRFSLLKTTLVQLWCQVVCSCNGGWGHTGVFCCYFYCWWYIKLNRHAQSKSKFSPLLYLCHDLQQVAVYVLRSGNIPVMLVLKSRCKSYHIFFLKRETIHMFFIPLNRWCSTVSLSSAF